MIHALLRLLGLALVLQVSLTAAASFAEGAPETEGALDDPGPPRAEVAIEGRPAPEDASIRNSAAHDVVAVSDPVAEPSTLLGVVESLPGVAAYGQGGLLQGYSIRGLGGQRTRTLVAGIPILTDRRAGASGTFLDPALMGGVQVRRGAASADYGSGALGGVVDASPRAFEGPAASFGYRSGSGEWFGAAGIGNERTSIGASYRRAHDGEAADGTDLYSRFDQWNVSLQRSWELGGREFEVFALTSMASDVGKANTDYPERTTTYPDERHILASATLRSHDDWLVRAFAHPNSLDTEVEESGSTSEVKSDALDFGLHAVRWLQLGGGVRAQAGVDYLGRRSVDSREAGLRTLDDASQNEGALFASLSAPLGTATLAAGGRFTGFRQRNGESGGIGEWAGDGFVGASLPLGYGLRASLDLSTGTRFPTLGERFFSGTTGRGNVTANPDLEPERAYSGDLGLVLDLARLQFELHPFQTRVRQYIERTETAPDEFGFVNLHSGTIRGMEARGSVLLRDRWSAYFRAHALDGRSDDGEDLSDIPPDEVGIGLRYQAPIWGANVEYIRRRGKDDFGSGERALESADLLAARVWLRVSRQILLSVGTENLSNQTYYTSADRKAPLAQGRVLFARVDLWQ